MAKVCVYILCKHKWFYFFIYIIVSRLEKRRFRNYFVNGIFFVKSVRWLRNGLICSWLKRLYVIRYGLSVGLSVHVYIYLYMSLTMPKWYHNTFGSLLSDRLLASNACLHQAHFWRKSWFKRPFRSPDASRDLSSSWSSWGDLHTFLGGQKVKGLKNRVSLTLDT